VLVAQGDVLAVHHLENSRSQRVLWLLEELGVPYELVKYQRDPATQLAPAELAKIHPLGKSPVVTDGDTTLAESAAILEYLVETYGQGRLVPTAGSAAHRRYRYFMHYAEGSLMPLLLMKLIAGRIRGAKVPFFIRPVTRKIAGQLGEAYVDPNLARHVAFLDGELATSPWFGGDELSAADVQMSFPMEALAARHPGVPPRITEWVAKVRARPAFQRAIDKGGAYSMLD
jgi:glutathione S-transferase